MGTSLNPSSFREARAARITEPLLWYWFSGRLAGGHSEVTEALSRRRLTRNPTSRSSVAGSLTKSAERPRCAMAPRSSTIASLVSSSAISVCCSTRTMAMLRSDSISFIAAINSSTITGARPSNGSSSSSSAGLVISARAIASICCSPPESWLPMLRRRSASRGNSLNTAVERPRARAGGGGKVFIDAERGKSRAPAPPSRCPWRARLCGARRLISLPRQAMPPERIWV